MTAIPTSLWFARRARLDSFMLNPIGKLDWLASEGEVFLESWNFRPFSDSLESKHPLFHRRPKYSKILLSGAKCEGILRFCPKPSKIIENFRAKRRKKWIKSPGVYALLRNGEFPNVHQRISFFLTPPSLFDPPCFAPFRRNHKGKPFWPPPPPPPPLVSRHFENKGGGSKTTISADLRLHEQSRNRIKQSIITAVEKRRIWLLKRPNPSPQFSENFRFLEFYVVILSKL